MRAWPARLGAAPYAALSALFLPPALLAIRERRLFPWDEAFYARYAVELYYKLVRSPLQWPSAMRSVLRSRPPAISWLGQLFVPAGIGLGSMTSGLLLMSVVMQAASVLLLFFAFHRIFLRSVPALLACFLLSSGLLFYQLSISFFVEPLQALSVVWLFVVVALEPELERTTILAHVVAAVSFGLLVKVSTPFFQAPLVALLLLSCWRNPRGAGKGRAVPRRSRVAATGAVAAAALLSTSAAMWYLRNHAFAFAHVAQAASGSQAWYYSEHAPGLASKLPYWGKTFRLAFSQSPLLAAALLGVLAGAVMKARARWRLAAIPDRISLVSASWILTALLVFSLNVNEDWRYLLALFPYLGAAVCWALSELRSRLVYAGFAVLCCLQLVDVNRRFFDRQATEAGSVELARAREDVDFTLDQTCEERPAGRVVLGTNHLNFNNEMVMYRASVIEHGSNRVFGCFGYDADADRIWESLRQERVRYYVFRTPDRYWETDMLNRAAVPVLERIMNDPLFRFRPERSNGRVQVYEKENLARGAGFCGVGPEGRRPFGQLDSPQAGATLRDVMDVQGWAIAGPGTRAVRFCFEDPEGKAVPRCPAATGVRLGTPRPDVGRAYPRYPGAALSGWSGTLGVGALPEGTYQLSVRVSGADGDTREVARVPVAIAR